MGEKFVGSNDLTLLDSQVVLATPALDSGWFELPECEMVDFEMVWAAGANNMTITLESDLGIVDGAQKVHEFHSTTGTGNDSEIVKVNTAGLPGGRRVRAVAQMDAAAGVLTVEAKETRSGLS